MLFYGHLESVVSGAVSVDQMNALAPLPIDHDRWRLCGYHVVDWVLRSRGRVFTATEITSDGQPDPLLRVDGPAVTRLLRYLVRSGVLEVASEGDRPDATEYGNPADTRVTLPAHRLLLPAFGRLRVVQRERARGSAAAGTATEHPLGHHSRRPTCSCGCGYDGSGQFNTRAEPCGGAGHAVG